MEYTSFNKNESINYFDKIIKKSKNFRNQFWQISYKKKFAGTIALVNLRKKKVELRYAITSKFWNKGIFQICLDLIFNYATKSNINKIIVKTRIDNFASLATLIKFRFKIKKIIKKNKSIYYLFEKKL